MGRCAAGAGDGNVGGFVGPFAKPRLRAFRRVAAVFAHEGELARLPFSPRHSQSRAYALSGALRLPLLMKWRSLGTHIQRKIRASTIFRWIWVPAELVYFTKLLESAY